MIKQINIKNNNIFTILSFFKYILLNDILKTFIYSIKNLKIRRKIAYKLVYNEILLKSLFLAIKNTN